MRKGFFVDKCLVRNKKYKFRKITCWVFYNYLLKREELKINYYNYFSFGNLICEEWLSIEGDSRFDLCENGVFHLRGFHINGVTRSKHVVISCQSVTDVKVKQELTFPYPRCNRYNINYYKIGKIKINV